MKGFIIQLSGTVFLVKLRSTMSKCCSHDIHFVEDALHHFPRLSFSPEAFSHVGFKLRKSPTSSSSMGLSLLSGFGSHLSSITSHKIRLFI